MRRTGKRAPLAARGLCCAFLEISPGKVEALQRLTGHSKMETTQIYLRRLDRERAMERVRDLSWGSPFASIAGEARTGFEPVYEALQASA